MRQVGEGRGVNGEEGGEYRKLRDMGPLSTMARWKSLDEGSEGEARCRRTDSPPADWPKIVT